MVAESIVPHLIACSFCLGRIGQLWWLQGVGGIVLRVMRNPFCNAHHVKHSLLTAM